MKENIHPQYRTVIFHDTSVDAYFKVGSTIQTDKTIEYEGQRYPYVTLDVSSQSHPFYTGKQKHILKKVMWHALISVLADLLIREEKCKY